MLRPGEFGGHRFAGKGSPVGRDRLEFRVLGLEIFKQAHAHEDIGRQAMWRQPGTAARGETQVRIRGPDHGRHLLQQDAMASLACWRRARPCAAR